MIDKLMLWYLKVSPFLDKFLEYVEKVINFIRKMTAPKGVMRTVGLVLIFKCLWCLYYK